MSFMGDKMHNRPGSVKPMETSPTVMPGQLDRKDRINKYLETPQLHRPPVGAKHPLTLTAT
jgi:hypothetical protein